MAVYSHSKALLACLCLHLTSAAVFWPKEKVLDLDIPTPPHVTEPQRQRTDYASLDTRVELYCAARGNPAPTLQWLRDGEPIPLNSARLLEYPQNGTLVFPQFTSTEEGYFRCVATNQHGVSLSHVIELRLRVTPPFQNDEENFKSYKVREGDGIALPCYDRPTFKPPGPFSWYYKFGDVQDQIPVRSTDRFDIDANGTLYITMAESADERDSYACAVQSDLLRNIKVAGVPYIKLQVTTNNDLQIKPRVLGSTGYITADKGGEVTLECFFSGKPSPRITWRDGSRNVEIVNGTGNRFFMSASAHKLKIKKLTDDDQGNYICEARNLMGSTQATTFLNVTSRPLFERESPQIIIAPTGSDATFSCVAKGAFEEQELAPPEWFIDGKAVPFQDDKFSLSVDGTALTVHDVTKDDVMCVQCNVSNSRGYAFGDGYLAVVDPLVLTAQPNNTLEIEAGTVWLNLTIAATSDRCCPAKFSWSLNGKNMPKTSLHEYPYSYHLGRNVAILAIRVDGPEAEVKELVGRYRCDVWHSVYSQNRTVTVDVRVKPLREPEKEKLQAAETNYWWIGVLGGVLVFIIAIVLIALMIRYNYPRQEYLLDKEEKKHRLNPEQDLLDQSFEEI